MPKITLDIILYTLFLGANLIIGLRAGRRVKTLRDFSIGNKDFSTATITSTIVATWIGGGFMFYALENIYTNGLLFIIPMVGGTLCLLFTGRILAIRMGEFLNNLSIAEAMGDLYGRSVRVITAISGILSSIGVLAIQFQVIAKMLSLLLGIKGSCYITLLGIQLPVFTILSAFIVMLYSAFGGIRSVIITDLFQFFIFIIFIPLLGLSIWNNLKDPGKLINAIATNPIFNLSETLTWSPKLLFALGLMLYYIIPGMQPALFQRVIIAKNIKQVKNSFSYAAGLDFLITMSIAWIAILLLTSNPNLEPSGLVNHIITQYAYAGLKGMIAVGITAMAMSTADSMLNSSAVLAVNDIMKPFNFFWENPLRNARLFSLGLGICALLLALVATDLLKLALLGGSFYMPIVTVPLLLAIFGFRSRARSVLIGMSAGFITVALWDQFFGHLGVDRLIPGMVANLIFFMGSHYLLREEGGWVGIKDPYPLLTARREKKNTWLCFIQTIRQPNLYTYLQQNLPTHERAYPLMGIYIFISSYLAFYFFKDHLITAYPRLQHLILHSILFLIAGLVTYPIWNEAFKKKRVFIMVGWYLSILYVFFFLGALIALFNQLEQESIFLFAGNLIIASFLLPFPLFLGMFLIALPISWATFQHITQIDNLPTGFNFWQFKMIYLWILLGSSVGIIFHIRNKYASIKVKLKQAYLEKLEVELTAKLFTALKDKDQGYETELRVAKPIQLQEIKKVATELKDSLEKVYVVELNTSLNEQLIFERLGKMMHELNHAFHGLRDKLNLSLCKITPNKLFEQVLESFRIAIGDEPASSEVILKCFTTFKKVECDVDKIIWLMNNTLQRAQKHNPTKKPLIIKVENTTLVYRINGSSVEIMREDAIRITISTRNRFIQEQDFYVARPNKEVESTLPGNNEPYLLQNVRILDSHYGYMGLELITATDYQQFYILPIKVAKLMRSKRLQKGWMSA